jgi:hypothetical protein
VKTLGRNNRSRKILILKILAVAALLFILVAGYLTAREKTIHLYVTPPASYDSHIRIELNGRTVLDSDFKGGNGSQTLELGHTRYGLHTHVRGLYYDISVVETVKDIQKEKSFMIYLGRYITVDFGDEKVILKQWAEEPGVD